MEMDTSCTDCKLEKDTYLNGLLNSFSALQQIPTENRVKLKLSCDWFQDQNVDVAKAYLREANALQLPSYIEIEKTFDKYFYCAEWINKKIPKECLKDLTIKLINYMMNFEKAPNEDYRKKFICPICYDILVSPKTMTCGHTFCENCIQTIHNCPVCSKYWIRKKKDSLNVDILIKSLVSKCYPEESAFNDTYLEAVNHIKNGNLQLASEVCRNSLKQFPSNEKFILLLIEQDCNRGRPNEVEKQLLEVFKTPRRSARLSKIYYRLGKSYVEQKKYEDALISFCIAIRLNKFLARGYYSRLITEIQKVLYYYIKPKTYSFVDPSLICQETGGPKLILRRYEKIRSTLAKIYIRVNELKDDDKTLPNLQMKQIDLSDFECCICALTFFQPVLTTCGHTFCADCLKFAMRISQSCPYCRKDLPQNIFNAKPTELIVSIIKDSYPCQYFIRFVESRKLVSAISSIPALPYEKITVYENEAIYDVIESLSKDYGSFCFVNKNIGTVLDIHSIANKSEPLEKKKIIIIGSIRVRIHNNYQNMTNWHHLVEYDRIVDEIPYDQDEIEYMYELHQLVHDKITSWYIMLSDDVKDDIVENLGEIPEIERNWARIPDGPAWHWWAIAAVIRADVPYATHMRLKERYIKERDLTTRLLAIERHVDVIDYGISLCGFRIKENRIVKFRDRSITF